MRICETTSNFFHAAMSSSLRRQMRPPISFFVFDAAKRPKAKSADMTHPRHSNVLVGSTLAIWSLIFLLLAAFVSLQYYLPKAASSCLCPDGEFVGLTAEGRYNDSSFGKPQTLPDGRVQYELAVVSDLDQDSKVKGQDEWHSFLCRGRLFFHPDGHSVKVEWFDTAAAKHNLSSELSSGGRAMELSDLCVYDGHLLTVDDRTGVVYRMDDFKKMVPWVLLNDGPGNTIKGFKGEWMTVRDKMLYVGGLGKEWTTQAGDYKNNHPMYVKVITPNGEVSHVDWTDHYKALRRRVDIEWPGYMIHESGQWSDVHKKWFFLPRRASKLKYNDVDDEHMGKNWLLTADADFANIDFREIGVIRDGFRGFSAFQFLPNTADDVIVALKSEERNSKPVASYLFIYRLSTNEVLLDDERVGPYKFEGLIVGNFVVTL
uniref:Apyrase n=1 Tax=Globodera rostochiensis TaxID=31243 RepID=A0A914H0Q2_GLORO